MGVLDGIAYEERLGEFGLLNPAVQPADEIIAAVCRRFAASSGSERNIFRSRVSEDDFYMLMTFGQRCAALALKANDPQRLRDGLAAVTAVKWDQFDKRDYHCHFLMAAAGRMGLDVTALMGWAAGLAEPGTADFFKDYERGLKSASAHVVETRLGLGFLPWSSRTSPTITGLLPAALAAAELMEATERYLAAIEGDGVLPDHWFRAANAERLLMKAPESAHIHGRLTARAAAGLPEGQGGMTWLGIWLAPFPDAETPAELARLANVSGRDDVVVRADAQDRLLCLSVASTSLSGAKSIETPESLSAVYDGLRRVLMTHSANAA